MDFRYSKANARYARNTAAGGYFFVVFGIVGIFGNRIGHSTALAVLFIFAVMIVAGLWYRSTRRMRKALERVAGSSIALSAEGLRFSSPPRLAHLPPDTINLRYSELESFRVIRKDGPRYVAIRRKDKRWLTLLPLEDMDGFIRELRQHLPEEKRVGWFGDRWQRI